MHVIVDLGRQDAVIETMMAMGYSKEGRRLLQELGFSHEPLGLKPSGLSLPLRTDLNISRSTSERDNRHHDRCPRDVYGGVPISVIGMAASLTKKSGLTLAVRFGTVAAFATRTRRVARVYRVQGHTC